MPHLGFTAHIQDMKTGRAAMAQTAVVVGFRDEEPSSRYGTCSTSRLTARLPIAFTGTVRDANN
jgi:hypothetical protein